MSTEQVTRVQALRVLHCPCSTSRSKLVLAAVSQMGRDKIKRRHQILCSCSVCKYDSKVHRSRHDIEAPSVSKAAVPTLCKKINHPSHPCVSALNSKVTTSSSCLIPCPNVPCYSTMTACNAGRATRADRSSKAPSEISV
jgi:hypothetical protein